MKKIFKNPKVVLSLGFLILPLFLIVFSFIIGLIAPEALKFPKPDQVFQRLISSLGEKKVLDSLGHTFRNILVASILSVSFGVVLGFILGYSISSWRLSQPTIDFFRSIPVTFLIPSATLLVGVTSPNIVWMLATYPCVLIMVLNVRAGLSKQETERMFSFSIISGSLNPIKRFFKVTLREILPDISTGFRISLSYCIVIVTVLEYASLGNNGSNPGIGKLVSEEAEKLNYPMVYALIFLIGFIGFALNKIIEIFDYFFLHWSKNNLNDIR